MSKTSLICFVALTISASSVVSANDALKKKALELFPQADTNGDGDPTVPVDVSRHLYQVGKDKGANVSYTEVKNAAHMLKAAKGSSVPPSMTWNEAQQLVVKQTLEWVK